MNTEIEIIKWGKGYYVTKRCGCNVTRQWVKTKKAMNELVKKWKEN